MSNEEFNECLTKIIMTELQNPYCDSCLHNKEGVQHRNVCENCYRHDIGWEISEEKASNIVKKIIDFANEVINSERKNNKIMSQKENNINAVIKEY